MANTKTLIDTIETKIGTIQNLSAYVVNYDTIDTDLELRSALTGRHIGIFAWSLVEANAGNITLKSGSTTINVPQFGASSGILQEIKPFPLIFTKKGEALSIASNITLTPFFIVIGDFDKFYF